MLCVCGAVEADLLQPEALLAAVLAAGLPDPHDFVFVQSLVRRGRQGVNRGSTPCRSVHAHRLHPRRPQAECCRAAGPASLAAWQHLAGEHGVISIDSFQLAHPSATDGASSSRAEGGGLAAATAGPPPAAAVPHAATPAQRTLSAVPETTGEGEEGHPDEAGGPGQGAVLPAAATAGGQGPGPSTAVDLLSAAAAVGLLPRPVMGCHFVSGGGGGSIAASVLHLDQIPFAIRQGHTSDAEQLEGLQACALQGGLQRAALAPSELRARLAGSQPGTLCWVTDIEGYIAAAVMLEWVPTAACQHLQPQGEEPQQPAEQQAAEQDGGVLRLVLAAVHPALEERVEICCALGWVRVWAGGCTRGCWAPLPAWPAPPHPPTAPVHHGAAGTTCCSSCWPPRGRLRCSRATC